MFEVSKKKNFEFVESASYSSVRGRLFKSLNEWEKIGAPNFILDVISEGYKIPFISLPTPKHSRNNGSALKESQFVNEAVKELLRINCIESCDKVPDIVNPLSVSIQSSGKKGLIIDLRHINSYVYKQKFKCEDMQTALVVISQGFFLFNFDLKSGYHHVEIFQEHRKYLSFGWEFGDGVTRYFSFCVLPFGLSSAPYLFTKLFKPVLKFWRSQGIPIVMFLDDGLGGAANELSAKNNSLKIRTDLV